MLSKYRLTTLLVISMMVISTVINAQSSKVSSVIIELTYEDSKGKKHSETIEYQGKDADSFDVEAYEKELKARDIKILNLNINQSVSETKKGELHEDHDITLRPRSGAERKATKKKKSVIVKKMIISDSDDDVNITKAIDGDTYKVEEKDGKIFINGKEVEGDSKQIRIMKTIGDSDEMNVEVKDGKVYINGEEVDESEMNKSSEHKVIIKKMNGGDAKNIWISNDGEEHDIEHGKEMIFISDDDAPQKPRLGIMIEDGQSVNGAEIVEVVPDSPAAKAGLQKGDTVTAVDGQKVYGVTSMMDKVSNFQKGDEVEVAYDRSGKSMTAKIKLEMINTEMKKTVIIKKEK